MELKNHQSILTSIKRQKGGYRQSRLTRAETLKQKPPWPGRKPELDLTNCWRLSINNSECLKTPRRPSHKGYPTVCWVSHLGALIGPHSKCRRKFPVSFGGRGGVDIAVLRIRNFRTILKYRVFWPLKKFFSLEDNCFTVLWWFLLYNHLNHLLNIYPFLLQPPSHLHSNLLNTALIYTKTILPELNLLDDNGWDGWMASPTRWTSVWASSRSWWWPGEPGVLQSMGVRVGDN